VEDIERTHILEALATIVAERGVGGLTLADTLARSGVTRRTFYGLFDDLEAALLAAFDVGVLRARERIAPVYDEGLRWRDAIRPALAELLRFLDDEPALGRLCVVHSLSGGPELLRRRAEVQAGLWRVVDSGRSEGLASRTDPPAVVAEGVVGAVLTVVQTRLLGQDSDPPDERPAIELFGSLMSLIVLPYLGHGAAQRELGRPAPAAFGRGADADAPEEGHHPGEYHGVRLTYRTGRVLSAIAQYPGASNREVAERAGIVDQGQVSKLLARLQSAGVVENLAVAARGAPNAWRLTDLGERVERGVAFRYGPLAAGADGDPARSGRSSD
jgi:AcrR family transcriptional regulator